MELNKTEKYDFVCELTEAEAVFCKVMPRQYIMPECYGRGTRLCDIQVPSLPNTCMDQMKGQFVIIHCDQAAHTQLRGKGRGAALRQRTGQHESNALSDDQPGAAGDCGETNTLCNTNQFEEVLLEWKVLPPNVVQLEGLSSEFDMEALNNVVAHYGNIIETQVIKINGEAFVRCKLDSPATCIVLVSSIHDRDVLGSGKTVRCFQPE